MAALWAVLLFGMLKQIAIFTVQTVVNKMIECFIFLKSMYLSFDTFIRRGKVKPNIVAIHNE